ncbi:FecR family protein [uncultured Bacteroides sp.]|uniref:FecR family protein n=1 Tax=uncultured Bacteroides sp. TaxID=162156 RepID=UPI0025D5EDFC|nr:FecR domain-containing protein [uncultured Bacteroides sp.]
MNIELKYKDYSINDFLEDELFLQWQLLGTETLDQYWGEVRKQFPHQESNIAAAISRLHSMEINHCDLSREEEDIMLKNIYTRYHKHKLHRLIYWSAGVAASLVLLFALSLSFTDFMEKREDRILADMPYSKLDTIRDVQLIIGQKKTITVAEDADISWTKKDEIAVNGRESNSTYKSRIDADVVYSTLLVPYGKRSFMELPDGTKVWINSGTEVRFPVSMEGKERKIYVDGEIYIEVAEDKKRPFYVHTSGFEVRVYGTKFNVTSYRDDLEKSVVLLEGSVSVSRKKGESEEMFLRPNQMFSENERETGISDVNAAQYISWKDGIWQFTSERLESVALRLSRYYGKNIHCEGEAALKSCTGKLVLFEDADRTLQTIAQIFNVKYKTDLNEITISINP